MRLGGLSSDPRQICQCVSPESVVEPFGRLVMSELSMIIVKYGFCFPWVGRMNERLMSFSRNTKVCGLALSPSLSLPAAAGVIRIVRWWIEMLTFLRMGDVAEML